MTIERTKFAAGMLVLSMLMSGCASSGAPAPVEQRQPVSGGTYARPSLTPPPSVPMPAAGARDSQVQITGLGDDGRSMAPQSGAAPDSTVAAPAPLLPAADIAAQRPPVAPRAPATTQDRLVVGEGAEPTSANPAIVALINRANKDAAAGRQDASAASLERALKIEPGNAWLWHRLAQTRLELNQPAEAASLAARSNSLAGDDNALRARNWRLIAKVHQLRGESVAAQAAQRKAEALERGTS